MGIKFNNSHIIFHFNIHSVLMIYSINSLGTHFAYSVFKYTLIMILACFFLHNPITKLSRNLQIEK